MDIPGTWHEEKSRFHVDKECRYCWRVFKSFSWPTHLKSNVHQARLRKLAIPAYMKGKLPLSKDIGRLAKRRHEKRKRSREAAERAADHVNGPRR